MPETLDIQRVISTSTSNVSIDDLTKKGFKQVKMDIAGEANYKKEMERVRTVRQAVGDDVEDPARPLTRGKVDGEN